MDAEEKTKYDPNIVSSTVYIICISLQVATIAVNYKVCILNLSQLISNNIHTESFHHRVIPLWRACVPIVC